MRPVAVPVSATFVTQRTKNQRKSRRIDPAYLLHKIGKRDRLVNDCLGLVGQKRDPEFSQVFGPKVPRRQCFGEVLNNCGVKEAAHVRRWHSVWRKQCMQTLRRR